MWSEEVRARLEADVRECVGSVESVRQLGSDIRAALGEIERLREEVRLKRLAAEKHYAYGEAMKEQAERAEAEVERLRSGWEIGKKLLAGRDRQVAEMEVQARADLDEIRRLKAEVDGWKARMIGVVGEDRIDMAGNAVLRLKSRLDRAESEVERLRAEVSNTAGLLWEARDLAEDFRVKELRAQQNWVLAQAEVERLRDERQEDIFRLERLRADAFARAERAEAAPKEEKLSTLLTAEIAKERLAEVAHLKANNRYQAGYAAGEKSMRAEWYRLSGEGHEAEVERLRDEILKMSGEVAYRDRVLDKVKAHREAARACNERLEARVRTLEEALRKLTVDAALQGRAYKGNEELPGAEEFYRGYNAGIKAQFEYASDIARAALAGKEKP